jgi:hypothetical protein
MTTGPGHVFRAVTGNGIIRQFHFRAGDGMNIASWPVAGKNQGLHSDDSFH